MPSYVVPPKSKRLTLPCGEWIEVKERLNHGEYQDFMARCYLISDAGLLQRVPFKYAEAKMTTYLLDWSLVGLDEQPIVIRGAAADDVLQAIRKLERWLVTEIREAIEAHETAVDLAREQKKTAPTGDPASSTT